MRDSLIVQQPASTPRGLVTDSTTCVAALDSALALVNRYDSAFASSLNNSGYDHVVMEFGPYLLLLLQPAPGSPAALRSEFTPLFVFRKSDIRYLGIWMI